jgi:hypothetical protein
LGLKVNVCVLVLEQMLTDGPSSSGPSDAFFFLRGHPKLYNRTLLVYSAAAPHAKMFEKEMLLVNFDLSDPWIFP